MKEVKLKISERAVSILALIPPEEKQALRKDRRLVRIRKNLMRELTALNKEIARHRPQLVMEIDNGWVEI